MADDEWPILDPIKLQAAFDSMPSVKDFESADRSGQAEILAIWQERFATGDEFERKAADTRLWWVDCADRFEIQLQRDHWIDVVTEDLTR